MANLTQSILAKSETTVSVKWVADITADYLWFSTDGGSSWSGIDIADGTNGTYVIDGLTAGATYTVKTKVRDLTTQLTIESNEISVEMFSFPYAVTMPDFTIGDKLTIKLYNPLARTVNVSLIGDGGDIIDMVSVGGDTVSGFNSSEDITALYDTIPTASHGDYRVRVVYGTHSNTANGGKYYVNEDVCAPSIGTASYEDTNTSVITITGNDRHIVQNRSTVSYSVNGLIGKYGATISSVTVAVNGESYNLTLNGSSATGEGSVIDSGTDVEAVFSVTDSRGATATKAVNITMLEWHTPQALITLNRQNNYNTATDIKADVNFSRIGSNSLTITYTCTRADDPTVSVTGSLVNHVAQTINLNNPFAWSVEIVVSDRFGGSTTYNLYVAKGVPIVFIDKGKSSVGINCFPQNNNSVEVNGYDLSFHASDTFTIENAVVAGTLTSNSTEIKFSIVLPRIASGLSVSVTALKINALIPSGGVAVGGSYTSGGYDVVNDNTVTITPTLNTGNMLTIRLDKSSFSGSNNIPLAIEIDRLSMSFS